MNTLIALLTGGGLVAASTYLTAWQASRNAGQRDQAAHTHQLQMAKEARQQERLDRAYTELGVYLAHESDWARSVHPFIGPVPAPDPMTNQERWRIEALVTNHGSPEVRALLERWGEQRLKIHRAEMVITMAEKSQSTRLSDQALQERLALEDNRKAFFEAAEDIRAQMNAELAGQPQPTLGRGDPARG
jgi:hypothetical protein